VTRPVEISLVNNEVLAWKETNDLGNAERLQARFGAKLCWLPVGGWAFFDDTHWSLADGARQAALAAQKTVRALRDEAEALERLAEAPERWPAGCTWDKKMLVRRAIMLKDWMVKAGNSPKINGMLAVAANLMMVPDEEFDTDPLALNVRNGTLRFVKGVEGLEVTLSPHDPGDRFTKLANVNYYPKAVATKWEKHLSTCLADDSARAFFQDALGYTMTGLTTEQCVFMDQGRGGDGKSTAMMAFAHMLGSYAATASINSFLSNGKTADGSGPSSDLARLHGDIRMVSVGEPPKGSTLNDSRIKIWTGSGDVVARKLHKDDFSFKPRSKLWFECNGRPKISGDDDGIWRRILILLWPHQFPVEQRVLGFEEQLYAEAAGVLNWAIVGLGRWLMAGKLTKPDVVTAAVAEYRRANNHFGDWLGERTVAEAGASTLSKSLYADYKEWCEKNEIGERDVMSSTKFGLELGDRQFMTRKNGQGNIERRGIRLKTALEDDATLAAYDAMADEEAGL
jgi:putative DNA primase/helicase